MQGKQKVCIHAQKKHPIKKRFLHSFTANADQMKQNRTMHSQATEIIQIRPAQAKDITDRLQIRVESLMPKGSAQKLKQRSMTHPQQAKRLKPNSHTWSRKRPKLMWGTISVSFSLSDSRKARGKEASWDSSTGTEMICDGIYMEVYFTFCHSHTLLTTVNNIEDQNDHDLCGFVMEWKCILLSQQFLSWFMV